MFLLYSHTTATLITLLTLPVTKCLRFFPPHQAILQETSWVYDLIEFWHCLPGDRVRFHMLRVQSHKTAPVPLQMSVSSTRSLGYRRPSDLATNRRFSQLPLWVLLICKSGSQNSRKHVYQFIKAIIEDICEQPDEDT